MKKKIRIFAIVALGALILIQFIRIDTSNPELDPAQDIFSIFEAEGALIAKVKDACYDCHSNTTEYPWYTNIQPIGWWLKGHVNGGRQSLNFSEFGSYSEKKAKHKLEEAVEYTKKGWMPIGSFKITHPEARLSDLERASMVSWFEEQYNSYE